MSETQVIFCPKCRRPVKAADYFSSGGVSDWRIESAGIGIVCPRCGYRGLPLQMRLSEFVKMEEAGEKSDAGTAKGKKK